MFGVETALPNIVTQIERLQAHIDSQLDNLRSIINERVRPQYARFVSAAMLVVTVLSGLGALAYLPIKSAQDELKVATASLQTSIVPRAEHIERWRITERDIDRLASGAVKGYEDLRQRITDAVDRAVARAEEAHKDLSRRIDANGDRIVPRGELAEKWAAQTREFSDLQRQIDEYAESSAARTISGTP